jgi:hypothetical protein
MSFEVEKVEHGVLVRGGVGVEEFGALAKVWEEQGWTLVDAGIASAVGATFAVTNEEHREAWLKGIQQKAAQSSHGNPETMWLRGPDTGISSLTIFSVLSKHHKDEAMGRLDGWPPQRPLDPADFGRCHRLLNAIPAWRGRLPEVAEAYPKWGPLVRDWDKLEALYLEEFPSGRAPKCYEAMQACLREGDGTDASE